ncbi:hypothetical protein AYO39_02350 [Actinobacteria bacterium SCGC AG-212-D09]|nr:hypothetical protein AYO39_02350 [Actinobacteria bacterium SCGC AG-212-D09]
MDWENWLRVAAEPPSDNEDDKRQRTETQIRDALADYEGLQGRPYIVYAKGSYANNTNVRLNYDVDIAVEYRGFFYFDLCFDFEDSGPTDVGITTPSKDPYTRTDFKRDIRAALVKAFGENAIEDGTVAYRVREKKTTLPADVVPCWEYRRYDHLVNGRPTYHEGARIYPTSGGYKNNFPKRQLTNGRDKNKRTGYRYKRMVRALKKLETRLVADGKLAAELPSYLTECLVYNVSDVVFGHTAFKADMREVLAQIFNATLATGNSDDWEHVHGLLYLFRGSTEWTTQDVHAMADAAWDELGFE